jgi:hypothetical protein
MSAIRTFFRHCPSCGRRFEIRLVKKESVDSEDIEENLPRPVNPLITRAMVSNPTNPVLTKSMPIGLSENAPSIVDIEDFRYTYKCRHCGHEWSEVHQTESSYDAPKGYTGD